MGSALPNRVLALAALLACAAPTAAQLVPLSTVDPTIGQEIRYHTSDNFVGRPIQGYEAAACWLTPEAADALKKAQVEAMRRGYSLLVYDCYRPQRAVDHFVQWAWVLRDTTMKARYYPDEPKATLFERGYISSRSGHSRGSTVDLTMTRNGTPVDMGTPFDFFDERSHTEDARIVGAAREHRMVLRDILRSAGFRNYPMEWWHYTLIGEPYPDTYFDVPIR